jgi:hypothetical protein
MAMPTCNEMLPASVHLWRIIIVVRADERAIIVMKSGGSDPSPVAPFTTYRGVQASLSHHNYGCSLRGSLGITMTMGVRPAALIGFENAAQSRGQRAQADARKHPRMTHATTDATPSHHETSAQAQNCMRSSRDPPEFKSARRNLLRIRGTKPQSAMKEFASPRGSVILGTRWKTTMGKPRGKSTEGQKLV